jgi:hypothetical protein
MLRGSLLNYARCSSHVPVLRIRDVYTGRILISLYSGVTSIIVGEYIYIFDVFWKPYIFHRNRSFFRILNTLIQKCLLSSRTSLVGSRLDPCSGKISSQILTQGPWNIWSGSATLAFTYLYIIASCLRGRNSLVVLDDVRGWWRHDFCETTQVKSRMFSSNFTVAGLNVKSYSIFER